MMNDEEMMNEIERVSTDFHGQIDDLYKAVGMVIIGRLFGWKVVRLAAPRSTWVMASKLFGDPKLLMDSEGVLAHKSFALKVIKGTTEFWDYVRGEKAMVTVNKKLIDDGMVKN
jgi:hypothetical protein